MERLFSIALVGFILVVFVAATLLGIYLSHHCQQEPRSNVCQEFLYVSDNRP